jgi:hypothetical protein
MQHACRRGLDGDGSSLKRVWSKRPRRASMHAMTCMGPSQRAYTIASTAKTRFNNATQSRQEVERGRHNPE